MFDPNLTTSWVYTADSSYMAARLLCFTGFISGESPVLAHHAVEKYLKGYLVSNGVKIIKGSSAWGHDLSKLAKVCEDYDNDFNIDPLKRRLAYLERYFYYVRYPSELPDRGGITLWIGFDSIIQPLDEIVAFVRPRIALMKEEWQNSDIFNVMRSKSVESRKHNSFKKRALEDNNAYLDEIDCDETTNSIVNFDDSFNFDTGEC
jgi:HEPN domain-containing protein